MHEDAKELPGAPAARSQRYTVNVYDCAGQYSATSCTDWTHVLAVHRIMRWAYPDKAVRVFNLDRCDYNTDGLTEDERDALDGVSL